ncbi:decapping and exoribonuclease protein-like [Sycon ciliatum]|uniref:decapping and exoribonuclease protein-like n=1 Tax=Sycon ciliatum TaxID=27933 RepID=UPI0031F6561D
MDEAEPGPDSESSGGGPWQLVSSKKEKRKARRDESLAQPMAAARGARPQARDEASGGDEYRDLQVPKPSLSISNTHSFRNHSVIGHYSQVRNGDVFMDKREACHCKTVPDDGSTSLEWDLNRGFEEFEWRDRLNTKADGLKPVLKWILHKLDNPGEDALKQYPRPNAEAVTFVVQRAVMTRILTAPYPTRESTGGWRLRVCRFQNTIYLCNDKTFGPWRNLTPAQKAKTYRRYGFERYLTSHIQPVDSSSYKYSEAAGYVTVVLTQLVPEQSEESKRTEPSASKARLFVLAAGVDGELDGLESPPRNYVELKTITCYDKHQPEPKEYSQWFLANKLLRAWAQCYPVGIPRIVFGFHGDQGILTSISTFKTHELPGMCGDVWFEATSLNFADDFTKWLEKWIKETDPMREMYEVTFEPNFSSMRRSRMRLCRVEINDDHPSILTQDFVARMMKQ